MTKEMTQEEERLAQQRRGARTTALIVGGVALAIFLFTIFTNLGY